MRIRMKKTKKLLVLTGIVIAWNVLCIAPLKAQNEAPSGNLYLRQIRDYTYSILDKVNNVPYFLSTLTQMALSFLQNDDSKTTAQLQQSFASLGSLLVQDINTQNSNLPLLTADLFGQPASSFFSPPGTGQQPAILSLLPTKFLNINDITYSSLLGMPAVPQAPSDKSPYNYVKYASGIAINHTMPGTNWRGNKQDQLNYLNYYATVLAVESFNSYALSNQIAERNTFTTTQSSLISQASSSSWIAEISTEELGKVLRQLLMFESQSYVLMTQLLQTERQLLNAQVMTNSILILNNQLNESQLVSKAQGVQQMP